MTLKVEAFEIDDADKESGFAQAAQAHLDATGETLTPEMVAASAFDAYIGSARRAVAAKLEQIDDAAAIAEVATLVDQKIAEKPQPIVEPAPMEPPVAVPVGP